MRRRPKAHKIRRAHWYAAGLVPFRQRFSITAELGQAFLSPGTYQHARRCKEHRLGDLLAELFDELPGLKRVDRAVVERSIVRKGRFADRGAQRFIRQPLRERAADMRVSRNLVFRLDGRDETGAFHSATDSG